MKDVSRYNTGRPADQWEPGSNRQVLRNLKGITQPQDILQVEYDLLIRATEKYLSIIQTDTRFTSLILRDMHREWLGELYPWAGQYRVVEVAKDGFSWPPAGRVSPNMGRFARSELRKYTPCSRQPADDLQTLARKLAIVHGSLLLIHPFREGNGRLARWLADLMAMQAGFAPLDYRLSNSPSAQRMYLEGVKKAYLSEYDLLAFFFADALRRSSSSNL
jgi:cell filamentation protein